MSGDCFNCSLFIHTIHHCQVEERTKAIVCPSHVEATSRSVFSFIREKEEIVCRIFAVKLAIYFSINSG